MLKVNILLAADANYIPYLDITLKSLFIHHTNLTIFILHKGDIPNEFFKERINYFSIRESSLISVVIDSKNIEQFRESGHISQATYLRYYIEDLFGYSESPYWIYLDCDLIANGDITQPFYQNNIPVPLMAISDPYVNAIHNHPYKNKDYFNAGVLYIYRDNWGYIKQDLIKITNQQQNDLVFGDQDVLNYYFKDNWVKLPKEYNFQLENIINFEKESKKTNEFYPKIIHFTGPNKPLFQINYAYSNICKVASLFRIYHKISWEDIVYLPLGFFRLKL